ncbi:hypothetical protein JTE90_011212 [Oedothorax gibbosus]|uniref:TBC1 domain family member 15 n=1 Tax=Oedothorax gibbosus TaxID=931172 RepID=A0AAV6VX13_9ARAC|nr:hypothetical protein JTE90_011212 [Oedothorax gibbosus]
MEGRKRIDRKVIFENRKVIVTLVGPLKDEAAFEGQLVLVEETHGPGIEWYPLKVKTGEGKSMSPDLDSSDWEDVSSTVGFKASHDESLDAVEIKAIRMPNPVKFEIADLKSYKRTDNSSEHKTLLTFLLKDGTNVPSFQFDTAEFADFCAALDNYANFKRSEKESNLFLRVDNKELEKESLVKSFNELQLFPDTKPHIITKIIQDPYSVALGGFSKVGHYLMDYVLYNGIDTNNPTDNAYISEMISGNILNVDINNQQEPGYEMITRIDLPPRPNVVREDAVTPEEWATYVDAEGRIKDRDGLIRRIFKGGLVNSLRDEAWKYLLNFYDFEDSTKDKAAIREKKSEAYFRMKLQWRSFTPDQESRFSALRDRKSLIEKDVSRTDRTHPYFEGEGNINILMLQDILMTYCMYNFDLGYVQGMSDILSPILVVMQDEVDAFWCFAGWLKLIGSNFELEQQGMKNQLQDLHRLLHFVDSHLCSYLEKHESGNLYFVFRWLLILFKRDFKFNEIMRLWEVLWTGLPCKNFHLLICIAILDTEKTTIMENEYGLTEILKHVNEMSYKINLEETLRKAEAIYIQIRDSAFRSDVIETILGLEHVTPPIVAQPVVDSRPSTNDKRQKEANYASNRSSYEKDNVDSIDEYVDIEQHHPSLFDLPY